ncbi:MAG: hypothetical protein KF817_05520 [Phycisphaeraceae bacterium]|nr:hypothetical protein [Phycisphaeraceae bacterium]
MRFLQALLIVVMVGGIVVLMHDSRRRDALFDADVRETRDAVVQLQRLLALHEVLEQQGHADRAVDRPVATTIDPEWFRRLQLGDAPPRNALLDGRRPWIEIAADTNRSLEHPPRPIATSESDAAFWYNPYRGIVRARVPAALSEPEALDAYNTINGTTVHSLFHLSAPQAVARTTDRP